MWQWFQDNSVWILIVASVIVLLFMMFNDTIRRFLSLNKSEKWHKKIHGIVDVGFWVFEVFVFIVMILAFIALALPSDQNRVEVTTEMIKEWFVDHGFRIILILAIGIVLWIAMKRVIPHLIERTLAIPREGESPEGMRRRAKTVSGVFLGLSKVLIILFVVFMVLSELNVSVGPILAGFGVAGLAVGFGAQYLIRDLIAGIFILVENQYRVGDVVQVAGVSGVVEEINLRKTVLRDLDGIVHHVPNGEIRVASNYSRHFARVNLDISVSYNTDLDYAIDVINRVCKEMAAEKKWSQLFITIPQVLRVNKLADSGIEIKVTGDVKSLQQWAIMGELRLRIKKEFDKVGIEIPWPHTKVYFGNKPGET